MKMLKIPAVEKLSNFFILFSLISNNVNRGDSSLINDNNHRQTQSHHSSIVSHTIILANHGASTEKVSPKISLGIPEWSTDAQQVIAVKPISDLSNYTIVKLGQLIAVTVSLTASKDASHFGYSALQIEDCTLNSLTIAPSGSISRNSLELVKNQCPASAFARSLLDPYWDDHHIFSPELIKNSEKSLSSSFLLRLPGKVQFPKPVDSQLGVSCRVKLCTNDHCQKVRKRCQKRKMLNKFVKRRKRLLKR